MILVKYNDKKEDSTSNQSPGGSDGPYIGWVANNQEVVMVHSVGG